MLRSFLFGRQRRRKKAIESGSGEERFDDTFDTFVPVATHDASVAPGGIIGAQQLHDINVWMSELPADVCPHELLSQYDHVVRRIALLWYEEVPLLEYLESLLVDTRGGRQGFPVNVAAELLRLNRFAHERFPGRSAFSASEDGYTATDWFAGRLPRHLKI